MLEILILAKEPFLVEGDWLAQVCAHNALIRMDDQVSDKRSLSEKVLTSLKYGGRGI